AILVTVLGVQFSEIGDRTLPDRRPLHARGQTPGSVRIAPYLRSCGLAAYGSPSSSSSPSSPSNGSLNCTGSLYGPSSHSGLGGSRRGGFSISLPVGQPLADDATHRALSAFFVVDAERRAVAVAE